MTQQQIYILVKENPRICSREIAEKLGIKLSRVCDTIKKMLDKDIRVVEPNHNELEELLEKYPNSIKYAPKSKTASNRIKLFEVIE